MKWFTIYWLDGIRSIICGETIDDAFLRAGYINNVTKLIDWYDIGVSETHWYDKDTKKWIKFEEMKIHINDIDIFTPDEIILLLKIFNKIIIEFENNDQLRFQLTWGQFFFTNIKKTVWINHISITYAEYNKGVYGDNVESDDTFYHYMILNPQYFAPDNITVASEVFLKRAVNEPFHNKSVTEYLEDIHIKQKIAYTD